MEQEINKIKKTYRGLMKVDIVYYSGVEYAIEHEMRISSPNVIVSANYCLLQIEAVLNDERRLPHTLQRLTKKERDCFINAKFALKMLEQSHVEALYPTLAEGANESMKHKVIDKLYDVTHFWNRMKQKIYLLFKIR